MTTDQLAYPPRITAFTSTFWEGLREKKFRTTRCSGCAHITFPPKPVCPDCWSAEVEWIDLSGTGVLRSYTEVCAAPSMFADEAPYILCLVDLDEGVRCLSRIRADWNDLRPDARVRVRFRESTPTHLFEFALAADEHDGDTASPHTATADKE
ncbi:OB-fold domain-containing protein [Nocardia sp. R6R-6]|uniref:OB-fold domain-containing protein n=1 Tax=Nocardia sp. R6R-6 TaxID=3459303 RepID=UPI00403D78C8